MYHTSIAQLQGIQWKEDPHSDSQSNPICSCRAVQPSMPSERAQRREGRGRTEKPLKETKSETQYLPESSALQRKRCEDEEAGNLCLIISTPATRKEGDATWYLTRVKLGGGPKIIGKLLPRTLRVALRPSPPHRLHCRASNKLEQWVAAPFGHYDLDEQAWWWLSKVFCIFYLFIFWYWPWPCDLTNIWKRAKNPATMISRMQCVEKITFCPRPPPPRRRQSRAK